MYVWVSFFNQRWPLSGYRIGKWTMQCSSKFLVLFPLMLARKHIWKWKQFDKEENWLSGFIIIFVRFKQKSSIRPCLRSYLYNSWHSKKNFFTVLLKKRSHLCSYSPWCPHWVVELAGARSKAGLSLPYLHCCDAQTHLVALLNSISLNHDDILWVSVSTY